MSAVLPGYSLLLRGFRALLEEGKAMAFTKKKVPVTGQATDH
jgi:hypothetical protein